MASPLRLSNNGISRLASSASSSATSITLTTGDGAKFPTLTAGQFFPLTIVRSSDGAIEIVRVTARSGDTLTVTRAQEGTTALSFSAGDRVELRLTAGAFTTEIERVDDLAVDGMAQLLGQMISVMDIAGVTARDVTTRAKLRAVPASASASGTRGEFAYDDNFIYVCIQNNTWKRVAISTW